MCASSRATRRRSEAPFTCHRRRSPLLEDAKAGYMKAMRPLEHFRELVLFGVDMLYRFATVPPLASPEGLQPVIFLDPYETMYALPVASNLHQFFETYTRYLEMQLEDPDCQADDFSIVISGF